MRSGFCGAFAWVGWGLAIWTGSLADCGAQAQDAPPVPQDARVSVKRQHMNVNLPRGHVWLPPNSGATALSTVIEAEAKYLVAQGDFVESLANASILFEKGRSARLDNWVRAVDDYFVRIKKNKEWRERLYPTYGQRAERHDAAMQKDIMVGWNRLFEKDKIGTLNWLLERLQGPYMRCQDLTPQKIQEWHISFPIELEYLEQIWLTKGSQGKAVGFRATEGVILDRPWPWALGNPKCRPARDRYADVCRQLMAEGKQDGRVDFVTGESALSTIDELREQLDAAYPREGRKANVDLGLDYSEAKTFLDSLRAEVRSIRRAANPELFKQRVFERDTLPELVKHMHRDGLSFASPPPGSEGAYQRLFTDMVALYVTLVQQAT